MREGEGREKAGELLGKSCWLIALHAGKAVGRWVEYEFIQSDICFCLFSGGGVFVERG